MGILPSFLSTEIAEMSQAAQITEIPREYGINFETGQLTGKIVEGIEAIKVWIWAALRSERFRFPIYSWDYGVSVEQYIGRVVSDEYLQADCADEITEAMLVNPYITDIEDFTAVKEGDRLHISFTAVTKLGNTEVAYDV